MSARIILLDNRDSFVYNLVDALSTLPDVEFTVFRNTVAVDRDGVAEDGEFDVGQRRQGIDEVVDE